MKSAGMIKLQIATSITSALASLILAICLAVLGWQAMTGKAVITVTGSVVYPCDENDGAGQ